MQKTFITSPSPYRLLSGREQSLLGTIYIFPPKIHPALLSNSTPSIFLDASQFRQERASAIRELRCMHGRKRRSPVGESSEKPFHLHSERKSISSVVMTVPMACSEVNIVSLFLYIQDVLWAFGLEKLSILRAVHGTHTSINTGIAVLANTVVWVEQVPAYNTYY